VGRPLASRRHGLRDVTRSNQSSAATVNPFVTAGLPELLVTVGPALGSADLAAPQRDRNNLVTSVFPSQQLCNVCQTLKQASPWSDV